MEEQPEALRLADLIGGNAAAELRRLHEVNADLLEALLEAENALSDYIPTIERTGAYLNYGHKVLRTARAAIAKATGETK